MISKVASPLNLQIPKIQDVIDQNTIDNPNFPIIAHCHLRWDGVWQRPQQFLSRLSRNHPILFTEGPVLLDKDIRPFYEVKEAPGYPNITILQSYFPSARFGDGAWVDAQRYSLLKGALNGPLKGKFREPVQWFYDPMAVEAFANKLGEQAIVYDCMDQLSQFKFAPPELLTREKKLLAVAHVVFAGGKKLHEAKSQHNRNSHFYGCGVEVDHFAKAREAGTKVPADIAKLKKPVLGYFGVVDERMDYDLVQRLAETNPEWSVVILGPVVKVDPASLPVRPNLFWMGRREYGQLPNYTKAFDVCLMPFALNEATEYINPTKALEYMATGRPIVSTAVPDVVSNFGNVVKVARSPEQFIQLCKEAVNLPDKAAVERGLEMAGQNTWDSIVSKLEGHIIDVLKNRSQRRSAPVQYGELSLASI